MRISEKTRFSIAVDGFRFIVPAFLLTLALLVLIILHPHNRLLEIAAFLSAVLSGWVLYFFRDPERKSPGIEGSILSPADGKVTQIDEVEHSGFPGGKCRRVSVFLSIFNVHVNRAPLGSQIGAIDYNPGKFLNAMNEKSSTDNESNCVEFINGRCKVYVKQIAGLIARRIVCYAKPGEQFKRGDRYGLIRFGSRVDTFFPLDAEVRVKRGMHVKGGESILAVLDNPLSNCGEKSAQDE
ncbi:phosphatidylserine decarboxylase family protein [Candidatus Sumerlaeota bacterium]|nr:phosphatidylserine decarboxylase family protein [Candidatus Sumerlaeota bacterium]